MRRRNDGCVSLATPFAHLLNIASRTQRALFGFPQGTASSPHSRSRKGQQSPDAPFSAFSSHRTRKTVMLQCHPSAGFRIGWGDEKALSR